MAVWKRHTQKKITVQFRAAAFPLSAALNIFLKKKMIYTIQLIKTSTALIKVDAEDEETAKKLAINNAEGFKDINTTAFVIKMSETEE